ncbi:MAG: pectin acetylesterase-family hydrolase, partial [Pseudomonadota bacterium]
IILIAFAWLSPTAAATSDHCESAARQALGVCTTSLAQAQAACFAQTGAACSPDDPVVSGALAALSTSVASSCTTADIRSAGLGQLKTTETFTAQLQAQCSGEIDTITARSLGGPNAVLLADNDTATETCLLAAFEESGRLLQTHLGLYGQCLATPDACQIPSVEAEIEQASSSASAAIATACPDDLLRQKIGLEPEAHVALAADQAQCMTSATQGSTAPFALDCRPTNLPQPDVATAIVIDDLSIARCADGSPYRFWVKTAAEADPRNVLIYLQGGGVCSLENQCASVAANNPGLFTSQDDTFPDRGILGESASHPFADYTRVYLPYCTQDVFIGGGATQVYNENLTVERWGGRNVRAALAVVRNMLWGAQRDTFTSGYRPDDQRVLFSGNSAGGFGVIYNYHHLLDDLRWQNTNALAGAALALDNGQGTGILLIGALVQGLWDARQVQPSYCQTPDCAVGPVLAERTAARLDEQKLLWISNQVDATQANTTNFTDPVVWTNAVRDAYCAAQGADSIRYFLSARPSNTHGMLAADSAFLSVEAAGIPLTDWLAVYEGGFDAVSEGSLVADIPSVAPFDCTVDQTDLDLDGIGSATDNCLNIANADQIDADVDGIGNACDTDLNNDCVTNALDLGLFRQRFFSNDPIADFNSDGVVNAVDLGVLRRTFFTTPGPTSSPSLCGD